MYQTKLSSSLLADNAEAELKLCTYLWLRIRAETRIREQDYRLWGKEIFDSWFLPAYNLLSPEQKERFISYPPAPYPEVCTCGNRISPIGSVIRRHCTRCRGNYVTDYNNELVYIPIEYSLHSVYFESILAKVLYYGHAA